MRSKSLIAAITLGGSACVRSASSEHLAQTRHLLIRKEALDLTLAILLNMPTGIGTVRSKAPFLGKVDIFESRAIVRFAAPGRSRIL